MSIRARTLTRVAARGSIVATAVELRRAAAVLAVALAGLLARARGAAGDGDPPPSVRASPIPLGPVRLAQMAAYSRRHYGEDSWQLAPRAIVLHYTCGPSFSSAWHTFANNTPHHGEQPGVCAHYVVEQDGTVHELVPPTVRCRHTTGLNHVAIGVEFVQPCVRGGARAAEAALLARAAQMDAGARLVRALQQRFTIATDQVIGHAMANRSPLFRDLTGRTNDHGDWGRRAVDEFRRRYL